MIPDISDTTQTGGPEETTTPVANEVNDMQTTTATTTEKQPLPKLAPLENANIVLGQSGKAMPEGLTNFGNSSVEFPNEAQQRAGFFYDKPGLLIAQWPQFKYFKPKGER